MEDVQSTVMIVDDDPQMRESLDWLLRSAGFQVESYASPLELLEVYDPEQPGCLVVDLKMPDMNGLELQQALLAKGSRHPFIVISGHGDVSSAVESLHLGAVDFIEKPFDRQRLLDRVNLALERDAKDRVRESQRQEIESRIGSLTPRELEVMQLVVQGMLTKQIARQLQISDKTVEVHRSHITKKMHVSSVAQLVRIVTEHMAGGDNPERRDK